MSRSTALVLAQRVAETVASIVDIDSSPAVAQLVKKGHDAGEAKNVVLVRTSLKALVRTEGDEEKARHALIIVNAQPNRLPQCINLLNKHSDPDLVAAAYRLHGELNYSTCTISHMCRILEALEYVPEEDDTRLAAILDEIADTCISDDQSYYWLMQVPQLIRQHDRDIEIVLEHVVGEITHQRNRFGTLSVDPEDEASFWEELASFDPEAL